jgi:hypothetical protein
MLTPLKVGKPTPGIDPVQNTLRESERYSNVNLSRIAQSIRLMESLASQNL